MQGFATIAHHTAHHTSARKACGGRRVARRLGRLGGSKAGYGRRKRLDSSSGSNKTG